MKIAAATTKVGRNDRITSTFGRAPTFTIFEVDGSKMDGALADPVSSSQVAQEDGSERQAGRGFGRCDGRERVACMRANCAEFPRWLTQAFMCP